MIDHRVEITDSRGQRIEVRICLRDSTWGTWRAVDFRYFRYVEGVVDTCYSRYSGYYSPASPLTWVSLYGGKEVDDSKLVLHLDDFCNMASVEPEGTGKIYLGDTIFAEPGTVTWRLLDGSSTGL